MIQLTEEIREGWCVIAVRGRADAESADDLEAGLCAAIDKNARVAADLSGLDYVSSAGLRAFIQAARAAETKGGKLAICSPGANVKRVFDLSGLHHILNVQGGLPC